MTRRTSEKARGTPPKTLLMSSATAELAGDRKAAAVGDEVHERLKQLLVCLELRLAEADGRTWLAARDAGSDERLLLGRVLEQVEDARSGSDDVMFEYGLDPVAKLFLRVELLERPLACNDAVALVVAGDLPRFPFETGGNDEQPLARFQAA